MSRLIDLPFQEIEASGFAGISLSTLAGNISLSKLTMSLKWSKIGTLHMLLVQVHSPSSFRCIQLNGTLKSLFRKKNIYILTVNGVIGFYFIYF